MKMDLPHPDTMLASAGVAADASHGGIAPPLWCSDTSEWPNIHDKPAYDYSRTVNPNRDLLLEAISRLEGASGGAITASGQSAGLLALLLLGRDAHVVAPHDCYGGTYRLLAGLQEKGWLKASFVDQNDEAALERTFGEQVDLFWIESPSNPLLRVTDIRQLCDRAHQAGARVIADNTVLTPCRQKPLELGCDLVMHSTTKALNGHHDLFGGALLGRDEGLVEEICWWANAAGISASAFDSWQTLRGLRTLGLRLDRQESSARRIAGWLSQRPEVTCINYPGLPDHPQAELVARQQSGPGFMLSFQVKGGEEGARAFVEALDLITLASSLGGFSTLICTPSTMTHRGMPPRAQERAGVTPGLLRLSVGLEHPEDLIADLERALSAGGPAS